VHPLVVHGVPSTSDEDAVVLMLRTADDGTVFRCGATMIAPNLALTARHCVSSSDEKVNCDIAGNPTFGGKIEGDYHASDLRFYVGAATPSAGAAPSAIGAGILHDGATNLCAHDLAFVLLDRPLDVPIAGIRRDADPRSGEAVRVVGWGLIDDSPATPPDVRQRRDVGVVNVGPKVTEQFLTLTPADFSLGESICSGDSGGPVLARDTGAVVGVISHGDSCVGPGEYNVMTKLAPFRATFDAAFAAAGAQPKLEDRISLEGGSICGVGGAPSDAASAVLVSAFFLWARRRPRRAK
jgi:hypothetical protein